MPKPPIHLETRDAASGRRLSSPSAQRNKGPMAAALKDIFPVNASVLEIASGTGEQGVEVCRARPDLSWQMSDPDARSRQSQDDWRLDLLDQINPSLPIDVMKEHWWSGLTAEMAQEKPYYQKQAQYDVLYCANMIHIAPWAAALGLAKGAVHILSPHGLVILYGPFLEGADSAASNLAFDESLKRRNPEWGVRSLKSVKHIFADIGFNLVSRVEMPRENLLLGFARQG